MKGLSKHAFMIPWGTKIPLRAVLHCLITTRPFQRFLHIQHFGDQRCLSLKVFIQAVWPPGKTSLTKLMQYTCVSELFWHASVLWDLQICHLFFRMCFDLFFPPTTTMFSVWAYPLDCGACVMFTTHWEGGVSGETVKKSSCACVIEISPLEDLSSFIGRGVVGGIGRQIWK